VGGERPERVLAEEGGVGTAGIDGGVKSFEFLSGEQEIDTTEANEGGVLDREAFRKLELGNEWGGGKQVEVLLPMAFVVRVFGVVGGRTNVRREKAG